MTDLADHLIEQKKKRDTRIRQGKVISIQAGPPRTLTVEIGGTNYTKISCMAHVDPVVNENVWMMDIGQGRWIAFGATSNSLTRTNFVKLAGDTMTGMLTVNMSGESLKFTTSGQHISWFNGATREGYLQGNSTGLILNSENGQNLRLIGAGGVSIEGAASFNSTLNGRTINDSVATNRIVSAGSSGYIFGNYFNMTADASASGAQYLAGQHGGDNYLRWYAQTDLIGELKGSKVTGKSAGNAWTQAGVLCYVPGGAACSVGLYNGTTAPVMGSTNGTGNNIYFRNGDFTANTCTIVYGAKVEESSIRFKKNVAPWPPLSVGAAAQSAVDQLMRLRPITFQAGHVLRPIAKTMRRGLALDRLNTYRKNRDIEKYELPEHNCEEDDCDGTADDPCILRRNHDKVRLGLIAEEVLEVFPEAVYLDAERRPEGINYTNITVASVAAIQELANRVAALEGAA